MIRKFLLLCLGLSFSANLSAGHLRGAEINWHCQGGGKYVFTLTIFLDCTQGFPVSQFIQGPFGQISCTLSNQGSGTYSTLGSCNYGCIEDRWVFVSDTVSLSGVPPVNGWDFTWSAVARNPGENLTTAGPIHVTSTMYPYTPPGATSPLPADSCYNNSPVFRNKQPVLHCDGPYSFHNQLSDLEQDSIVVAFTTPEIASGQAVTFKPGYSAQLPFPDSTENPLNGPISLDSQTGLLQMEFYNANPGTYSFAIVAKEYRSGQLISEVVRDRPLYVMDSLFCSLGATNNRPNFVMSSNNNLSLSTQSGQYSITASKGDTIDLSLVASDFDFNANFVAQTICMRAQSNHINTTNPSLSTGCLSGNCATLTPVQSNSFCGIIVEDYRFLWVPDCSNLNFAGQGPLSFLFHFEVRDDGCPYPKRRTESLIVHLYPSAQSPVQLNLVAADTAGTAHISWSRLNLQTGNSFDYYRVFARPLNGTYQMIDSITLIDSTEAIYQNLPFPAELYVDAISGSCSSGGPSSNVINTDVALGLSDFQTALDFELSPNPATNQVRLNLKGALDRWENAEVRLYTMQGSLVQQHVLEAGQDSWDIPLQQIPGIYLIEFQAGSHLIRKRLVID